MTGITAFVLVAFATLLDDAMSQVDCTASGYGYEESDGIETSGFVLINSSVGHDPNSFVGGLFMSGGYFYETSNRDGAQESSIRKWQPGRAELIFNVSVPFSVTGLGKYQDFMYMQTLTAGTILYNFSIFAAEGRLIQLQQYMDVGGGRGITSIDNMIATSSGTNEIELRDPYNFTSVMRIVSVQTVEGVPANGLYELEAISSSLLLANIRLDERILEIDINSGLITAVLTAGSVLRSGQRNRPIACTAGNWMNGIAVDKRESGSDRNVWLTGRQWPTMFKVQLPELVLDGDTSGDSTNEVDSTMMADASAISSTTWSINDHSSSTIAHIQPTQSPTVPPMDVTVATALPSTSPAVSSDIPTLHASLPPSLYPTDLPTLASLPPSSYPTDVSTLASLPPSLYPTALPTIFPMPSPSVLSCSSTTKVECVSSGSGERSDRCFWDEATQLCSNRQSVSVAPNQPSSSVLTRGPDTYASTTSIPKASSTRAMWRSTAVPKTTGYRSPKIPDETHLGDSMHKDDPEEEAGTIASVLLGIGLVVLVLYCVILFVRRRRKYTLLSDGLLSEHYNDFEGDGDSVYNNPSYLDSIDLDGSDEEEDLVWRTAKRR